MTREIKLSLIFGFALVLVVGVLISDHLSGASRSDMAALDTAQGLRDLSEPESPTAVPELVLLGEDGRPAPVPAAPIQFEPTPRDAVVLASPVEGTNDDQQTLLEKLRERVAQGMDQALDDLAAGDVPPGAYSLSVDPSVAVPDSESVPVAFDTSEPKATDDRGAPDQITLYTVKEGDTLWSIASRMLGDGRLHKQITEMNKDRLGPGGSLRAGASIKIPARAALADAKSDRAAPVQRPTTQASKRDARPDGEKLASASVSKKPERSGKSSRTKYEVKKGDTLSEIAARTLGSASRQDDIIEANRDLLTDEDSLQIGMVLRIPAGG